MSPTQSTFFQPFLDYLTYQKRYSPHTVTSYQNDIESFFHFLYVSYPNTSLVEIVPNFIRSWLAQLKESGLTSKSINRKISALKSFFKFHLREGLLVTNPMEAIISLKMNKRLPQYVEEKDTSILFNHVEFPDNWDGRTHQLIFHILYHTGIRQAELLSLKQSQVDKRNSALKVLGKGNKERILPVNNQLMNLLQAYIADKETQFKMYDKVFLLINAKGNKLYAKYVYNVVNKYLSGVTSIDKNSPHTLRHTFATHLMNNGADINAVKELLGHSSLASTQVYTHNSIQKLKDIYNKAHPKS